MADLIVNLLEACPELSEHPQAELLKTVNFPYNVETTFSTQSIGNCGTILISNVRGGLTNGLYPKLSPELQVLLKDEWGSWGKRLIIGRRSIDWFTKLYNYALKKANIEGIDIFKPAVTKLTAHGHQMYVFTDSVNGHSRVRNNYKKLEDVSTATFAYYLIKNKIGYVVQSPVAVNTVHQSPTDFSLIRGWFWIPPKAMAFKPDKYNGMGVIGSKADCVAQLRSRAFNDKTDEETTVYLDSYRHDAP